MTDSKRKSLYKSISWRIIAMSIGYCITYLFTKSIGVSIGIIVVSNVIAIIIFYFHERLWNNWDMV